MPTIGPFHRFYWKARTNTPPPAGQGHEVMYAEWQSTIQRTVTLTMAIWGVPFEALGPIGAQLRWYWTLARRLWRWRAPENQDKLETWIARLEEFDAEEVAILDRVLHAFAHPRWRDAQQAVRVCATTPKFHQPEQWVEYGRALKGNPGQAQNVFRHIRVVHVLRGLQDDAGPLSNPDAHLLAELAYQGFAALGRPGRKVVAH